MGVTCYRDPAPGPGRAAASLALPTTSSPRSRLEKMALSKYRRSCTPLENLVLQAKIHMPEKTVRQGWAGGAWEHRRGCRLTEALPRSRCRQWSSSPRP